MIEARPWGIWELLHRSDEYAVKRLMVKPGQRLSLQYHLHRSETWYCVSGRGIVTIDEKEIPFTPGSMVSIPQGAHHRVVNDGVDNLTIVEIWEGLYLQEDDIIRVQDDYERI